MSSKYRSRIKTRKPRKIRGGSVKEVKEVIKAVAPVVAPVVKDVVKDVAKPIINSIPKERGKDIDDFRWRSLHNFHHAHSFVLNASEHVLHGHRAISNILAGGGTHPFHGNVRPKDFHDWSYPQKVHKQAYKDIAKSDRESLVNAIEDEYDDHKDGKSGAGLFHALNAVGHASAHWARK